MEFAAKPASKVGQDTPAKVAKDALCKGLGARALFAGLARADCRSKPSIQAKL